MKKMAFIGAGNMGGAIVRAVCTGCDAGEICVCDHSAEKMTALAAETGCQTAASAAECAEGAKYVVIGVKPNGVRTLLQSLSNVLTEEQIIISMAAGVTGAAISEAAGRGCPVVRIIPNTPCAIGKGLMLLCPCGAGAEAALPELKTLLAPCGLVGQTDEAHADACMTVAGCVPAFAYMFIEALADGAVLTGLPRADATSLAAQAVLGAAAMVLATGQSPAQLKDAVCSPGGSTIEGVRALEQRAFRGAAIAAVDEAYRKNASMGK